MADALRTSGAFSKDYGVTDSALTFARSKIELQAKWLESQQFVTKYGEIKNYLQLSMNPNHGRRYYSMLQNKVDTLCSFGVGQGLEPVFITVTLDGFFRDFLRGDFSRFDEKKRARYKNKIPNSDRYGYLLKKLDDGERLTVNDLYRCINYQFRQFLGTKIMRKLSKEDQYIFIQGYEPHKDGVPHFHCLLYVPKWAIPKVFNAYTRVFPAPRNHKRLTKRDGGRVASLIFESEGVKQYETHGFQLAIKNPVGYIMKYILKSMNDKKNNNPIDKMQAWYILNRIPRIVTSRTIVPQWVWHHAYLLTQDKKSWLTFTELSARGCHWRDFGTRQFEFKGLRGHMEWGFNNGYYYVKCGGDIVKEWGEVKELKYYDSDQLKKEYARKSRQKASERYALDYIPVDIDGKMLFYERKHKMLVGLDRKNISSFYGINRISDQQLLFEYQKYDVTKNNPQRYASMKRELVHRRILPFENVIINDFSRCNILQI